MDAVTERLIKWSKGEAAPPYRAQINLTRKCNLKCIFCWQRSYDPENIKEIKLTKKELDDLKKEMPEERLKEIVEECGKIGVKEIVITGNGETLLRLDLFLELMKIIKKYKM